jgi:pRiA4b ORF-3-like protein
MAPPTSNPPGQSTFQLRIQLNDVDPAVWRRVLVPGSVRMAKLSEILLAAMGWTNSHLHAFRVGDRLYGMNFDEYPDGEVDEKDVTVLQALRDERRFVYEYDFGDSWEHDVVIEDVTRTPLGLKFGVCVDGQNACPPEDVGGTGGYAEFLAAIADPAHEEHDNYLEWAGGPFDPAAFDLVAANAALQRIR